jgi:hypothetical protein
MIARGHTSHTDAILRALLYSPRVIRLLWIAFLALPLAACGSSDEAGVTDTPSPVRTETPRVVNTVANPRTPLSLTADQIAQAKQIISDSSQASGLLHDLVSQADRGLDTAGPVVNDENYELIGVAIVLQFPAPIDVPESDWPEQIPSDPPQVIIRRHAAHNLTRAEVDVDLRTRQVTRIMPGPATAPTPSG